MNELKQNYYDEQTQTQFSPAVYELYDGDELLQSEPMDFQTHLYKFGEMERYLKGMGFKEIKTYSSFDKKLRQTIKAVCSYMNVFADNHRKKEL